MRTDRWLRSLHCWAASLVLVTIKSPIMVLGKVVSSLDSSFSSSSFTREVALESPLNNCLLLLTSSTCLYWVHLAAVDYGYARTWASKTNLTVDAALGLLYLVASLLLLRRRFERSCGFETDSNGNGNGNGNVEIQCRDSAWTEVACWVASLSLLLVLVRSLWVMGKRKRRKRNKKRKDIFNADVMTYGTV